MKICILYFQDELALICRLSDIWNRNIEHCLINGSCVGSFIGYGLVESLIGYGLVESLVGYGLVESLIESSLIKSLIRIGFIEDSKVLGPIYCFIDSLVHCLIHYNWDTSNTDPYLESELMDQVVLAFVKPVCRMAE